MKIIGLLGSMGWGARLSCAVAALCLWAPLWSSAAVGDPAEAAFLAQVNEIGHSHETERWSGLYCRSPASTAGLARATEFFTSARLDPPTHVKHDDAKYELSVCFETPTVKEMCELLPVKVEDGRLCVLP